MHIDPAEYNSLSMHQKALLLDDGAIFVDYFFTETMVYTLFAFSDWYIEAIVDAKTDDLINIVAFKGTTGLNKYLDRISLKQIL